MAAVSDLERTVEVLVLVVAEEALDPLPDLFEEERPPEDFPLVGSELLQVDISTRHLAELLALVGLPTYCPNRIRQSSSSLFLDHFPFQPILLCIRYCHFAFSASIGPWSHGLLKLHHYLTSACLRLSGVLVI